jgi:uncharacterized ParB-like nuclease family protein
VGGAEPFVVLAGEGQVLRGPVGGPTRIIARAETTNGGFTALENFIGPEQGPPEHIHVREDEMYYVFEGTIRFKASGRSMRRREHSSSSREAHRTASRTSVGRMPGSS